MNELIWSQENKGYTFPGLFFLRVPGCCSAGNIYGFNASSYSMPNNAPKENDRYIIKHKEPLTSDLDRLALLSTIGGRFTRDAACTLGLLMFAHRVTQCENPFTKSKLLQSRWKQRDEPGRYCWPSRIWTMYDRVDLKVRDDFLNTTAWGLWLEERCDPGKENFSGTGVEIVSVDGESVHAVGKGYTQFGSEKPDGHGTIRVWNIIVRDIKKLENWYNATTQEFLEGVIFQQGSNEDKLLW